MAGAGSTAAAERAGGSVTDPGDLRLWDTIHETIETFRTAAGAAGHDAETLPIMLQVNGIVTAEPLDERGPLLRSTDSRARPGRQARHEDQESLPCPVVRWEAPLTGHLAGGRYRASRAARQAMTPESSELVNIRSKNRYSVSVFATGPTA